MIDLDFLNNTLLGEETSIMVVMHNFIGNWFNRFDLNDDQVIASVQGASDFFNMDAPASVQYGWTTGVATALQDTVADDVLLINKQQMTNMGITTQEAFDLVMTHEGAHRALQSYDIYNDHQEELCCDTMAGVRAALNDVSEEAIAAMKASLVDTLECGTHPAGTDRVQAIDDGYQFAKDYFEKHNCAPTFQECLDHFNEQHNIIIGDLIDIKYTACNFEIEELVPLRSEKVTIDSIASIMDIDEKELIKDIGAINVQEENLESGIDKVFEINHNEVSFKSKTPPNHSSDGYIFQGGEKYNGFQVYKKDGHTYYWNHLKDEWVKIK